MVLELIVIGGAVYYYVRKNKQEYVPPPRSHPSHTKEEPYTNLPFSNRKAKKAAFAAGQPWTNKDGTVVYPPGYPGLPGLPAYSAGDYKRQAPEQPMNVQREHGYYHYSDAPVANQHSMNRSIAVVDEKSPLAVETREVFRDEKR